MRDDESNRYNNKDVPELREDDHPSGECSVLADPLPGVQGEIPAGRKYHQKVPEMRKNFHLPIKLPELAKILPGMSEKAYLM